MAGIRRIPAAPKFDDRPIDLIEKKPVIEHEPDNLLLDSPPITDSVFPQKSEEIVIVPDQEKEKYK